MAHSDPFVQIWQPSKNNLQYYYFCEYPMSCPNRAEVADPCLKIFDKKWGQNLGQTDSVVYRVALQLTIRLYLSLKLKREIVLV